MEELQQIPAKMEADIGKLRGKMEKLEGDKAVEEGHLQEVMASLKTETQVTAARIGVLQGDISLALLFYNNKNNLFIRM